MRKLLLFLTVTLFLGLLPNLSKAQVTYTPGDSIPLLVVSYDTNTATCPVPENPDTVRFWRYWKGALISADSTKTNLGTGITYVGYKAHADSLGNWMCIAKVTNDGKKGDKTWTWLVTDKTGFKLAANGLDLDTSFTQAQRNLNQLVNYVGADSNSTTIYYPTDGSANKDSARVRNSAGDWVASIIFHKPNVASVYDSSKTINKK